MELKKYQRDVLSTLGKYARLCEEQGSGTDAYEQLLAQDGLHPGSNGIRGYVDDLNGTPKVCVKVPTGGGKTFIAANAIKVLADELDIETKAVVWLVPRKEILRQTLRQLRDPSHPLRMAIDRDFAHRVEILDKEDALTGRGLSVSSVQDQLTVFVLSYDSFKNKDGRRAYAENSSLMGLTNHQRDQEQSIDIEGADATALISALAGMNPLVIVDESHHAQSSLSLEMLHNLNPRFTLELTATPSNTSNVITRVPAQKLKAEEMIKLPVIVYRTGGKTEVVSHAILLRRKLEKMAEAEEETTGRYIRPIALLQAEHKGADDAETFKKLKEKLVDAGIPQDHIAIRTGDVDEIGDVDLMSRECPIRYIITIEALSEGWDCPFAYVLATVANKSSRTSIEQLVGRVLRQPYARHANSPSLNTSYVLASSATFNDTIEQVVAGLNGAGFSKQDVMVSAADEDGGPAEPVPVQGFLDENPPSSPPASPGPGVDDPEDDADDLEDIDLSTGSLGPSVGPEPAPDDQTSVDEMLNAAAAIEQQFSEEARSAAESPSSSMTGMGEEMHTFKIRETLASSIAALRIPRYRTTRGAGLFSSGDETGDLFEYDSLLDNFSLGQIGIDDIHLDANDSGIARQIDISNDDEIKIRHLNSVQRQEFQKTFMDSSSEDRKRQATEDIFLSMSSHIKNLYGIHGLKAFIRRVVDEMSDEVLTGYADNAVTYSKNIVAKINREALSHRIGEFGARLRRKEITIEPDYVLPASLYIPDSTSVYDRTLYEEEDGRMNNAEQRMADALANCEGILWWHRVSERVPGEFYINGFINHYPDFLAMTTANQLFAIETKGEHLKNDDSLNKLKLGNRWAAEAGPDYQYFMVFDDDPLKEAGAYSFSTFKAEFLNRL